MKKYLLCSLCLCLVLSACLASCGSGPWTVKRGLTISQVGEDYVIGYLEGEGQVKVMCDAQGEGYQVGDALEIHYRVSKLKEVDDRKISESYDHVLTSAISIREAE